MDIRWEQRFSNYKRALSQLNQAVTLMSERPLSNLEKLGIIQLFEFTHELAWKTMKDFLESKGNTEIYGSKDASRQSFKFGLILDGEVWMHMILSRNLTSHTYNEKTVDDIIESVADEYIFAFMDLKSKLEALESVE
ncbi:nucleotidyltransferase substrate binding protein [Acetoanaerobium sticklandii]|uniref:nucleotidyltransferase substrate binding protein n=1 Tax=Acetoanaerobium sticklandii TaxID=1511 RepID=UPI003A94C933